MTRIAFLLALVAASSCASTTSVLVGPTCAKLSTDDSRAVELGHNALVLDHQWDLPGETRNVTVEYPSGKRVDVTVKSTKLFMGGWRPDQRSEVLTDEIGECSGAPPR
jgi:hypothetical protein